MSIRSGRIASRGFKTLLIFRPGFILLSVSDKVTAIDLAKYCDLFPRNSQLMRSRSERCPRPLQQKSLRTTLSSGRHPRMKLQASWTQRVWQIHVFKDFKSHVILRKIWTVSPLSSVTAGFHVSASFFRFFLQIMWWRNSRFWPKCSYLFSHLLNETNVWFRFASRIFSALCSFPLSRISRF